MQKIVNFTPHAVRFIDKDGGKTFPPSGFVARATEQNKSFGGVVCDGVVLPFQITTYGETEGLPPPADDTMLIVSALVRMANPDRKDLLSPGLLVRDAEGRIVGCESFIVNP